jgi:predicted small lipoprotein YifL
MIGTLLRGCGLSLAAVALLAACGQKGPLYLPDEGVKTPIEIRGPGVTPAGPTTAPAPVASPAASPAPAATPAEDDKDEAKKPPAPAG